MSIPIVEPTHDHPDAAAEHPLANSGTSHCGYRGAIFESALITNDAMTAHVNEPYAGGTSYTEKPRSGLCGLILAPAPASDYEHSAEGEKEEEKQEKKAEVVMLKHEDAHGLVEEEVVGSNGWVRGEESVT